MYKNNKLNTNSIIEDLLSKNIPNKKSKIKVTDDNFVVPKYENYDKILNINYNNIQLKEILKHYNVKNSGNKDILKKRCYNYLFYSKKSILIQSQLRRFFVKKYIHYHGEGFKNKEKCINDVDFATLDEIKKIPFNQFFSIKDDNNFIYAFDIQSLYTLYLKNKNIVENPFSTKELSKDVYNDMIKFIKYSQILKKDIKLSYDISLNMNAFKILDMKILNIFQNMDSLGNYTNMSWFTNLNKDQLIKFIHELLDIWNYRANLSQNVKREICPPYGNPFKNFSLNINSLFNYSYFAIKKTIVGVLEEFVYKGIDNNSKVLGSFYILSALTLVSKDAAESMPWLFESVYYVN